MEQSTVKPTQPPFQWKFDDQIAEYYQENLVPAIFAPSAKRLVEFAQIGEGDRVLDVACGTGVVSRAALSLVGSTGSVSGCDITPSMLNVARRLNPQIDWREADISQLPYADQSFDHVLCQMALMFFPDKLRALQEMARVTAQNGSISVSVPAASEPFERYVQLIKQIAGPQAAGAAGQPFSMANQLVVTDLFQAAGLDVSDVATFEFAAVYKSPEHFLTATLRVSPVSSVISVEQLLAEAGDNFNGYRTQAGDFEIPTSIHMVHGTVSIA